MDGSFRATLLILGALIVVAIVFDAVRNKMRQRREQAAPRADDVMQTPSLKPQAEVVAAQPTAKVAPKKVASNVCDIMMISLHADTPEGYGDYGFLQALGSAGLTFGEHSIFHYKIHSEQGMKNLFSVAKLNKPGTFDIDNIDSMQCRGLLFFFDVAQTQVPMGALETMLDTAYQLAEELGGYIYEGHNVPWREDTEARLIDHVNQYQSRKDVANEAVSATED